MPSSTGRFRWRRWRRWGGRGAAVTVTQACRERWVSWWFHDQWEVNIRSTVLQVFNYRSFSSTPRWDTKIYKNQGAFVKKKLVMATIREHCRRVTDRSGMVVCWLGNRRPVGGENGDESCRRGGTSGAANSVAGEGVAGPPPVVSSSDPRDEEKDVVAGGRWWWWCPTCGGMLNGGEHSRGVSSERQITRKLAVWVISIHVGHILRYGQSLKGPNEEDAERTSAVKRC